MDFYRNYAEYSAGFGDLHGNHWLGLESMHQLTKEAQELRVDMSGCFDDAAFAKYDDFKVLYNTVYYCTAYGNIII